MATTKLYLDTRAVSAGCPAPLKISICFHGKTSLYPTGIRLAPEYWDRVSGKVVRHPQRQYLNTLITSKKNDFDIAMLKIIESGRAAKVKSPSALRDIIIKELFPDENKEEAGAFLTRFSEFAKSRETEGNRTTYMRTISRMCAFDDDLKIRSFEDINLDWLRGFERFLERTSKSANGRAVHFRNIRAVFNDAISDEATAAYPFRKFKIKTAPTRKRSLSVEQLRTLMTYKCEDHQEKYRDIFILMFFLCGVNAVDLLLAKPDSICNNRLEYIRAKTHKLYSIKVEPEAMAIINKYKGSNYLLNIMDTRTSYLDFLRRMDRALKEIGPFTRQGRGGQKVRNPLFPNISQYWCRHTWATLASQLDIPKEVIAAGLGHGGNTVTDIYINFDSRKVDAANRKMIDYVLCSSNQNKAAKSCP